MSAKSLLVYLAAIDASKALASTDDIFITADRGRDSDLDVSPIHMDAKPRKSKRINRKQKIRGF